MSIIELTNYLNNIDIDKCDFNEWSLLLKELSTSQDSDEFFNTLQKNTDILPSIEINMTLRKALEGHGLDELTELRQLTATKLIQLNLRRSLIETTDIDVTTKEINILKQLADAKDDAHLIAELRESNIKILEDASNNLNFGIDLPRYFRNNITNAAQHRLENIYLELKNKIKNEININDLVNNTNITSAKNDKELTNKITNYLQTNQPQFKNLNKTQQDNLIGETTNNIKSNVIKTITLKLNELTEKKDISKTHLDDAISKEVATVGDLVNAASLSGTKISETEYKNAKQRQSKIFSLIKIIDSREQSATDIAAITTYEALQKAHSNAEKKKYLAENEYDFLEKELQKLTSANSSLSADSSSYEDIVKCLNSTEKSINHKFQPTATTGFIESDGEIITSVVHGVGDRVAEATRVIEELKPAASTTTNSKSTSITPSQNNDSPLYYRKVALQSDDIIQSKGLLKGGTVLYIEKDCSSKVVDRSVTSSFITAESEDACSDGIKRAFEHAKLALNGYKKDSGALLIERESGESDPKQAMRIHAALLVLGKDIPYLKIRQLVSGAKEPEIVKMYGQKESNEAFINQHLKGFDSDKRMEKQKEFADTMKELQKSKETEVGIKIEIPRSGMNP